MENMYKFPLFFKAIGHPVRQKILNILRNKGEVSVKELVKKLQLSQSTVSHHLSILKKARVVNTRQDKTQTFYSICCHTITCCCTKLQEFLKN